MPEKEISVSVAGRKVAPFASNLSVDVTLSIISGIQGEPMFIRYNTAGIHR